ncbi:MAG TPA: DUF6492 family protein, partial [Rugosimonospora sp.]|nr:DUF6492 family protein [Rugosimonospora sp.]
MTELAVITPTFRGDAELFEDLHRSVLDYTPPDTVHHVFVPLRDRHLFARYAGPRCRIWTGSELLPRRYVRVGRGDSYVDARRPWPPVRAWVTQQAIKIAAAARLDADVVLIADSDVVLVRPVRADRFQADGQLCLYREENAVTADMERHVIWHRVGRELFGLPPAPPPPLPDYVSSFNFWSPAVVRAMQQRMADTTGRDWCDAFTRQLHISEFMLYGIFVDEVHSAGRPRPPADVSVCHNTWQRTPLDRDGAIAFAEQLKPDAVAMMISAK